MGCCSHSARPHQSRWTAAGGFALPQGSGDGEGFLGGLPNLDWSVTLQFNPNQPGWDYPMQPPTKRFSSVRLAIPSRTLATPHGPRFSVFGEGGGQKYSRPALNPSAPARYFASIRREAIMPEASSFRSFPRATMPQVSSRDTGEGLGCGRSLASASEPTCPSFTESAVSVTGVY